jgi:hypothetical protein
MVVEKSPLKMITLFTDGLYPPPWQAARLTVLLDTLSGVPIYDAERRSLVWLAGFEAHSVENIAEVIIRARRTGSRDIRFAQCR